MSIPQTEQQAAGDYRLEVTDFGPIAKASVDLRPLTVFIGPSNTGKSYLAILMYALHRFFGEADDYLALPNLRSFGLKGALFPQTLEDVEVDWPSSGSLQEVVPLLSDRLNEIMRDRLNRIADFNIYARDEICRCFGINASREMIRQPASKSGARIALTVPLKTHAEAIRYSVALFKNNTVDLSNNIPSSISFLDEVRHARNYVDEPVPILDSAEFLLDRLKRREAQKADKDNSEVYLIDLIARDLFDSILTIRRPAYYLPASRSGIMDIDKALVRALIQNAATVSSRPSSSTPMLPGVLADFLEHLVQMPVEHSQLYEHAERLERHILRGAIRAERTASDYKEFFYRPEKWESDLPLMRASSMVSELAPVVLYLRHLAQPGDVLIIEEPESHLHPAMQAVFARELARLARSGIRVVVTTHSEWLLDQFANLVRLSTLSENKRKGIPGADEALRPEQFGAWLFKPKQRPKGSVVEEIRVDPEAGGLLTDYGDIAEHLYNQWAEIGNRITESGG